MDTSGGTPGIYANRVYHPGRSRFAVPSVDPNLGLSQHRIERTASGDAAGFGHVPFSSPPADCCSFSAVAQPEVCCRLDRKCGGRVQRVGPGHRSCRPDAICKLAACDRQRLLILAAAAPHAKLTFLVCSLGFWHCSSGTGIHFHFSRGSANWCQAKCTTKTSCCGLREHANSLLPVFP